MPKFTYWESLTPEPPNLIGAVEPHIRWIRGEELNPIRSLIPQLL